MAGALLVGYWLLMTRVPPPGGVAGDLSPAGNLAGYVDRLVLGPHIWQVSRVLRSRGRAEHAARGRHHAARGAGRPLDPRRPARAPRGRRRSLIGGLAATGAGWLWGLAFPINKALWTSSYALFMAGLAALALAACYWSIEVRGWRGWTRPFVVLGVTALPLFFLSSFMARLLVLIRVGPGGPRLQAWLFDHLFAPWLPPVDASLAYALAYVLLWWGLMWALHRSGVRLRV